MEFLELCSVLKGKFMLTMYPNTLIKNYSERFVWIIHDKYLHVRLNTGEGKQTGLYVIINVE